MATPYIGGFVSSSPGSRERRTRRSRWAAILVVATIAGSSLILQAFYDRSSRPQVPGAEPPGAAAFAYFPR